MVYDAIGLTIVGKSTSFNDIGEETSCLPSVNPASLRVELKEATLTLNDVKYTLASVKRSLRGETIPADTIRLRQAKEKVAQINAQIKKKGQKWIAGEAVFIRTASLVFLFCSFENYEFPLLVI
ncbi:hypothetical protein MYP_4085 [Sporocytophaga myxococcoides]|uniref:Uncharacterized protein n=1 Tax=Sporocytophaga myxococcoides TaxID=153721 RepID=A0A098LIT6_9BACT|nr:hypothetical protein MYP_4085 [Sporocytophaga myxococcoides]